MKVLVCVLSLVLAAYCLPVLEDVEAEWIKFQRLHARTYKSSEEVKLRKSIFTNNYQKILAHNELYAKGDKSHYLKINRFADMTPDEVKQLRGYRKVSKTAEEMNIRQFVLEENAEVPDEFDWRTKGAVTRVKNQGRCGSCWTFSATGALEAQYFFKTGDLVELSEQNLVDCSFENGNSGCSGGDMNPAFTYVFTNDGLDSGDSYPYETQDADCRYTDEGNVTSLEGYVTIESGSETDLKAAVAVAGPIAVAIDASHDDFSYYGGGIYYNEFCNDGSVDPEDTLDHAVLVVGYGNEYGVDYWLVKNSWGGDWGEEGYIKMARNMDNNCGIAAEASYPTMYSV